MFEFELNNVRLPKIRTAGSSGTGTGTTCIGTSTKSVMVSGTGTTLPWYQYHLASVRWYRYRPCSGTGTTLRDCPEMVDFAFFHSLFFHKSLIFHPTSKTNMESLQNNSTNTYNGGLDFLKPNPSQRIQGFIPKFTNLYKTIELSGIPCSS